MSLATDRSIPQERPGRETYLLQHDTGTSCGDSTNVLLVQTRQGMI